jgi:asparagine synthase (glutamine-hydrolysing)
MCGIAGYFFFSEKRNNCDTIREMSAEIAHRGPDDEGFVFIDTLNPAKPSIHLASGDSDKTIQEKLGIMDEDSFSFSHNLALAHRRFAIVDLSPSGHQPMWDDTGTLCVIFNGEIFNYIELREELRSQGFVFRTGSDTEVILYAYRCWGVEAFKRFSGFWAIVLYDRRENILVLSRDRIGKKPLYVYRDAHKFVWASEIKSILRLIPAQALHIDESSVWNYLYFGKRDVAHYTFWAEIKMMDNAAYAIVSADGDFKTATYWQLPAKRRHEEEITLKEAQTQFIRLLETSLSERLRADVPIAFELSGGMDSSAMVALRALLDKEHFPAFTVKYADRREDESPFAAQLARQYPNIDHHLIDFEKEDLWNHMNKFLYLQEEPFHNPSLLISQLLRKKIKDRGFKVLVGGSGGDEVMAGYTEYAVPIVKELLKQRKYMSAVGNVLLYKEPYPFRLKPMTRILLNRMSKKSSHTFFYEKYFTMDDRAKTRPPVFFKEIEKLLTANMKDLKMYYWMSSGDKAAMGIPIEVRAPFLSHRVVEFLFSLPVSYLMRNGWLKWLLRKSLGGILPDKVCWRKQKMGFPFPIARWLMKNESLLKGLLTDYAETNRWLDNRLIVRDYAEINAVNNNFLWRAVNFQLWLIRVIHRETIDFNKFDGYEV